MAVTQTGTGLPTGTENEHKDQSLPAAFFNLSCQDGLTALAGGGQSGATAVSQFQISRFTTVANPNDSAILGFTNLGHWRVIINATANAMNLYPRTGDQINALGLNNPFSIPAGKTALFFCAPGGTPAAGIWNGGTLN